ncbi:MAG: hypothetical protein MUP70_14260, partial [Candidatus Aminicenantes bacterium]|nr:hypothetical protein [Candidatus Aminicenantes bacterium]
SGLPSLARRMVCSSIIFCGAFSSSFIGRNASRAVRVYKRNEKGGKDRFFELFNERHLIQIIWKMSLKITGRKRIYLQQIKSEGLL